MGCGSCGTGVGGCNNKGGCSTGSCNRMNVYNWLADLPVADIDTSCKVVEVSFNNGSRKDYYRNQPQLLFEKGDMVTVEGINGFDVGQINLTGELVRLQLKKHRIDERNPEMKKVLRLSSEADLAKWADTKQKEKQFLIRSRAIARSLNLDMKLAEVEVQADCKKATFFYIADDRVDFRELIKLYAGEFKLKIEMRQIGARQEAGKVGGIGSCGRELCCSTWLTDFKSVNTQAARYQNLSINQAKLSGQCGRLKCCLNYELDTYIDALQSFPNDADHLQTARGRAFLIKKDIFKNLMWYVLPESTRQYPLTIETVKDIQKQNKQGIFPEELETAEVKAGKPKEIEPAYADLVGQISLKTLEKTTRKRRDREKTKQANPDRPQQQGNDGQAKKTNAGKQGPPKPKPQGNRPKPENQNRPQQNNRQDVRAKQAPPSQLPADASMPNPKKQFNPGKKPNRNRPPRPNDGGDGQNNQA